MSVVHHWGNTQESEHAAAGQRGSIPIPLSLPFHPYIKVDN